MANTYPTDIKDINKQWVEQFYRDLVDALKHLTNVKINTGAAKKFTLNAEEEQVLKQLAALADEDYLRKIIEQNANILAFRAAIATFKLEFPAKYTDAFVGDGEQVPEELTTFVNAPVSNAGEILQSLRDFMTEEMLEQLVGATAKQEEGIGELEFRATKPVNNKKKPDPDPNPKIIDERTQKQTNMRKTIEGTLERNISRDFEGRGKEPEATYHSDIATKINSNLSSAEHQEGVDKENRAGRYSAGQAAINKGDVRRAYINPKAQAEVTDHNGQKGLRITVEKAGEPGVRQEVCNVVGVSKLVIPADAVISVAPTARGNSVADAHNLATDTLRQMKKGLQGTRYDEQFVDARIVGVTSKKKLALTTTKLRTQLVNLSIKALAAGILPVIDTADRISIEQYVTSHPSSKDADVTRAKLFLEVQALIPDQNKATAEQIAAAHAKFRELFLDGEYKAKAEEHIASMPKAPVPVVGEVNKRKEPEDEVPVEAEATKRHSFTPLRAKAEAEAREGTTEVKHEVKKAAIDTPIAAVNFDEAIARYTRVANMFKNDAPVLGAMNRDNVFADATKEQIAALRGLLTSEDFKKDFDKAVTKAKAAPEPVKPPTPRMGE